jgi:hypothetical protein
MHAHLLFPFEEDKVVSLFTELCWLGQRAHIRKVKWLFFPTSIQLFLPMRSMGALKLFQSLLEIS